MTMDMSVTNGIWWTD